MPIHTFPSDTVVQCAVYRNYNSNNSNYYSINYWMYGYPTTNAKYHNSFIVSQYEKDNYNTPAVGDAINKRYRDVLKNAVIKHATDISSNQEEIYINDVNGVSDFFAIEMFSGGSLYNSPSGQYIGSKIDLNVTRGYNGTTITDDVISYDTATIYVQATTHTYQDNLTENINITSYDLFQNYPNPFNPSTTISYQVPDNCRVTLKVFDVLGKEVTTLVDEYKSKGKYDVQFNAKYLASGMHIYQIKAGDLVSSTKLMLMK